MINDFSAAPTQSEMAEVRQIDVDQEHFGVRFMVPVLAFGLALIWHIGGLQRLPDPLFGVDSLCLILPADVLIVLGVGYAVEQSLKRWFPSRRSATLTDEQLVLTDARHKPPRTVTIRWDQTVNVLAWRFTVKKRTRVPKGWYCLALHLLQDETELILYTFFSPHDAGQVPGYVNFVQLRSRQETLSNTDLSAVAEQRRLLRLEDARWTDGAEINAEDFSIVLRTLERHVPGWR